MHGAVVFAGFKTISQNSGMEHDGLFLFGSLMQQLHTGILIAIEAVEDDFEGPHATGYGVPCLGNRLRFQRIDAQNREQSVLISLCSGPHGLHSDFIEIAAAAHRIFRIR